VTPLDTDVTVDGTMARLDAADVSPMLPVTSGAIVANPRDPTNLALFPYTTLFRSNFLAVGEHLTLTYTVKADDGQVGGTDTHSVTVTINGTEDAPVISLVTTDSDSTGLTETNAALTASGTLTVTDADLSDTVTASV